MNTIIVERLVSSRIPTNFGEFQLCLYANTLDAKEHMALLFGELDPSQPALLRIHSECFTGDVLGSQRCDCGEQLETSLRMITQNGAGLLLYLRQEGRGIGLLEKLKAYNLQDEGYDTVDANLLLGHQADERDYTIAGLILKDFGVKSVRLITNNPVKVLGLEEMGIEVDGTTRIFPTVNPENAEYLRTKVLRMNHVINLDGRVNGAGSK